MRLKKGRLTLEWAKENGILDEFTKDRPFSFEKAREVVKYFGFISPKEYKQAKKAGRLPLGLPINPNVVYKYEGWKGWKDYLGELKDCIKLCKQSCKGFDER